MEKQISVVIPAYNNFHFTSQCLENLLDSTTQPQEVVVVDNASTDETPNSLPKFKEKFLDRDWLFKTLRIDVNQGFGRAVNKGFSASSELKYLAVQGNDTWLMKGWDQALIQSIEALGADMVGPFVDESHFDSKTTPMRAAEFISRNAHRSIRLWESAFMFFKRKSFAKVGMFDERFFLTYEDADLQLRMDNLGMTYFQVGSSYLWHKGKGTRGEETSYEKEGLKLFLEKWGFDPRLSHHTRIGRLKRRWKWIRNHLGYL